MNPDVLVVGAGPAGAVAATLLARAGARVRMLDRAVFPRDKLCGDTINPGTVAVLDRLRLAAALTEKSLPIRGMRVTGEGGVVIEGRYPRGLTGRALLRRDFDWMLLQDAVAAGVQFEPGVTVRRAFIEDDIICGVVTDRGEQMRASVTIAADGRHSTLAFGLGLAVHPPRPRRWAIGGYIDVAALDRSMGEMHVRGGHYLGIAPVPGGLTNVCLVTPWRTGNASISNPTQLIVDRLMQDRLLRDRFHDMRFAAKPVVLGPLAVDTCDTPKDGLLLAGDASGFIDPLTGDGLRFAVRGAELVAAAAVDALVNGWAGVHARLARVRHDEFAAKWRFNRAVRSLVASRRAVAAASVGARVAPGVLRRAMIFAGDCRECRRECRADVQVRRISQA